MPAPSSAARLKRWLAVIVPLGLWGLMTHSSYAGTGDEPHYQAIAHSLAFDLDVDLANNYGPSEPLIADGNLEPGAHVAPGRHGIARPVHDIGLPLLLAPCAAVASPLVGWLAEAAPGLIRRAKLTPSLLYHRVLGFAMIALAAVLARMLFDAFVAVGAAPRQACLTVLLLVLSPPLLLISTLLFTELLSAALAFYVFHRVAVRIPATSTAWLAVGSATGFLFLVHARNIGLVVPLALLACVELRRQNHTALALAFTAGLAVPIAVRTAATYRFWGTWLTTPHARPGEWSGWSAAAGESWTRLAGLLMDQEFGLLVYAPVYLLSIAGLVAMWKGSGGLAARIAFTVAWYVGLILCPLTNAHGWTGGWSPVARFLAPVAPILGIAVLAGIRALPRPAVAAVCAAQIAISAYMWQHPKLLWNDGTGRARMCAHVGETVCSYLPSFTRR